MTSTLDSIKTVTNSLDKVISDLRKASETENPSLLFNAVKSAQSLRSNLDFEDSVIENNTLNRVYSNASAIVTDTIDSVKDDK